MLKYQRNELIFSLLAILFLTLTHHYILASLCVIYTLSMLYLDNKEYKEDSQFDSVISQFGYGTNHIVVDASANTITICRMDSCILGRFNDNKLVSLEPIESCEAMEKLKSLLVNPKKESFKAYGHNYLAFDNYDIYFTRYYITDRKLRKKIKAYGDNMLASANGVELLGCGVCTVYNTCATNLQSSIFFFYLYILLFLTISVGASGRL